MTQKPTSPGNRLDPLATMRVVIVGMDTHLASAAARAEASLRREVPGVSLTLHAASEFGGDAAALERCRADIAQADIILCAMLFLEDHFTPILPDLRARRDNCDALVCIMSAGEVVKLTRMGRY